jgi:dienelactone hydrolase
MILQGVAEVYRRVICRCCRPPVTFRGADHAFFNDTGARYNREAATSAYDQLLAWFGQHLT